MKLINHVLVMLQLVAGKSLNYNTSLKMSYLSLSLAAPLGLQSHALSGGLLLFIIALTVVTFIFSHWGVFFYSAIWAPSIRKQLRSTDEQGRPVALSPPIGAPQWLCLILDQAYGRWATCKVKALGQDKSVFDPASEFEWDVLASRLISRRGALLWPGILTGIAIVATFFGLQQGLADIQSGGSDALIRNVNGLLSGMSLAFENSLGGILCSLVWAVAHAVAEWRGRAVTLELQAAMRLYLPSWNAEELNTILLRQQIEQTASMKSIGTDFALSIRDVLDEVLKARVTNPLSSLQQSLAEQSERISSVQEEGLSHLVESFGQQMRGAAGKEIYALGIAVAEFKALLVSSQESYSIVLENLERTASGLWPVVDKFTTLSANLDSYTVEIRQMQEVSSAGAEQSLAVVQQMQNAATELGGLYRQIQEGQNSIEGQIRQISQAWDSTDNQLSSLAVKVERAADHFSSDFVTSLKQVHGQIDELLSTSLSHFAGTLASLDEMMRSDVLKVLGGLKESTQQTDALVRESLAEAPKALTELASLSKGMSATLVAMQPMLSQLEVVVRSASSASVNRPGSSPPPTTAGSGGAK